ncbi:hypothetical protein [Helicobacter labacensis]|uniref:hypothetical protein n=1 Tax=Helicobacter labacensis TaxID=2316079 RepID=UPI000EAD9592|nr:hypothetical protein [Helicobacter labacensis]
MPLAPKPIKFVCSCGYSKVISFKSDCLSGADLAKLGDTCPKCGKTMQKSALNLFDWLFRGR